MVQEHHVHIANVQPVQTRLDGLLRVGHFAAGVDLRDNENIFPFDDALVNGLPDGLSHFFLVAIGGGGVDETDPAGQGGFDRIDAGFPVEAVRPQAVDGHFIAAVEGDAFGFKVESSRIGGRNCRFRQFQTIDPFLHRAAAGSTGEAASGNPIRAGGQRLDAAVAVPAGVGRAEGDDGFSGKAIALQEGADDPRRLSVPDGVAQEDHIVLLHVLHAPGNGGAGIGVVLLTVGTTVGVVVQVGGGVGRNG